MVCQVCGAMSGIYPLCPTDYRNYKTGKLVKCPTCTMLHLSESDCPRCGRSLLSDDLLIKRSEIEYWGTKLFAIAKGGKQRNKKDRDRQRYERAIEVSTGLMSFWAHSKETMAIVSDRQMLSWSESLKSIANEGIQQSGSDIDITRYADISRLSDEIEEETISYFGQLPPTTEARPAVVEEEFVSDADIEPRLLRMLDRAEKVVLIASPWIHGIDNIIGKLEGVYKTRRVHVRILTRPAKSDRDLKHSGTVIDLIRKGFQVMPKESLHAKMILVDDKELFIGSANLTSRSMRENREVGICTTNPEVVSEASMYFERVFREAFERAPNLRL